MPCTQCIHCMESRALVAVVNSLVLYALGFESPHAPPSDLSRHHAHVQFIEEQGTIIFLPNFYLETKLHYVVDGMLTNLDVRNVHFVIHQMYGNDFSSDLLPQG